MISATRRIGDVWFAPIFGGTEFFVTMVGTLHENPALLSGWFSELPFRWEICDRKPRRVTWYFNSKKGPYEGSTELPTCSHQKLCNMSNFVTRLHRNASICSSITNLYQVIWWYIHIILIYIYIIYIYIYMYQTEFTSNPVRYRSWKQKPRHKNTPGQLYTQTTVPHCGSLGRDPNVVERDSIRNLGSEKNVDMNPYQMQDPSTNTSKRQLGKHLEDSESVFVNPPWQRCCLKVRTLSTISIAERLSQLQRTNPRSYHYVDPSSFPGPGGRVSQASRKLTQLSMLTENHNRGESGSPGIMGWLHGKSVRLGRVTMGHSNFCPWVTSKKINLNLELRKVWNTSAFA